jgi:RNA polymerase sigma-70 factor, ECF subfamily
MLTAMSEPVAWVEGAERSSERPGEQVAGTHERMRAICAEFAQPLLRYLLRLTLGDREAAEDLLQETLLRTWRNIDRVPADLAAARPWLFTVARNHAIDVARSKQGRPVEVSTLDLSRVAESEDQVERMLTARLLREALNTLPSIHRVVLEELYLRGCTAPEAATRIGIAEGTVKSRAHYALRALRASLDSGS